MNRFVGPRDTWWAPRNLGRRYALSERLGGSSDTEAALGLTSLAGVGPVAEPGRVDGAPNQAAWCSGTVPTNPEAMREARRGPLVAGPR